MNRRRKLTKTKERKNYLPTLLLVILLWLLLGVIIWRVDPLLLKDLVIKESYLPFFVLLFLALALTGGLILASSRRGLLIGASFCGFLFLRIKGLGNMVNALLLFSLVVAIEYYYWQRKS